MNSVSLEFVEKKDEAGRNRLPVDLSRRETTYFAGGCYPGTEDLFRQVPGVDVVAGTWAAGSKLPTNGFATRTPGTPRRVRIVRPARIVKELLGKFFQNFHDRTV